MINKTLIQVFLIILIFSSLTIFYKKYFADRKNLVSKTTKFENKDLNFQKEDNTVSNLIYNLSYKSSDIENNQYIINSESGIMSNDGIEFSMNNVTAKIILNDLSEIIISSDNAIYNNNNYNTKFYGNVIAKYGVHTIFSDKINLDFEIKLATIYENVLYKNLETEIKTDKVDFDLNTKNILMSMNDKRKKINISSNF